MTTSTPTIASISSDTGLEIVGHFTCRSRPGGTGLRAAANRPRVRHSAANTPPMRNVSRFSTRSDSRSGGVREVTQPTYGCEFFSDEKGRDPSSGEGRSPILRYLSRRTPDSLVIVQRAAGILPPRS